MAPGYNQYHQSCTESAVHTWDEEDPLIPEPAMVSDDEDAHPTTKCKYDPIEITWT